MRASSARARLRLPTTALSGLSSRAARRPAWLRAPTAAALRRQPLPVVGAYYSSSSSSSSPAATMATLKSVLTPALLSEVHDCWFGHVGSDDRLMVPRDDEMKTWFMGGQDFDSRCVKASLAALQAIRTSGVTSAQQIIDAARPADPIDWMTLVILLDQMPRNCYRGDESSVVFDVFDPLARQVVAAARSLEGGGLPDADPRTRWFLARRMWFYLPLMHSEDLALHELATASYRAMAADVEALIADRPVGGSEGHADALRADAARLVAEDPEGARALVRAQLDFEARHLDIVKRFGRYPHRNAALGRESTPEEVEYLASGGETFGAKKD